MYTAFGAGINIDVGKLSQLLDSEHKEVFGRFLNDGIMSGETGCGLSRTNDNNVRKIRQSKSKLAF